MFYKHSVLKIKLKLANSYILTGILKNIPSKSTDDVTASAKNRIKCKKPRGRLNI